MSIGIQFLALRCKPILEGYENKFLLFNEAMVTLYLYLMILLTDYNSNISLRNIEGLMLLSIVFLSFTVNFGKVLVLGFLDAKKTIAKKYRLCRAKSITVKIKPAIPKHIS